MQTVVVKQDDLAPVVILVVVDASGAVVNLNGAHVTFSMRAARSPGTRPVDDMPGSVLSGPAGKIQYAWHSGDTSTPGTYEGEFHVAPAAGASFRAPTDGYIPICIEARIGD